VSADQQTENRKMADMLPVHRPSVSEGSMFMNCSVEKHHSYCCPVSRLSSSEFAECPDSIFDYHSMHPSVGSDDLYSDSIDVRDASVGCVGVDMKTVDKSIGGVIVEEEQPGTKTVISPQPATVTASTAVHVNLNCQLTAPLDTSKSRSSWGLPSIVSSSRMQSRLPAPRSRATVLAVPPSHCTGKSVQLANGLTLSSVAASATNFSAGSKIGPSRFH